MGRLPAPQTALIGRARELEAAARLLACGDVRLVTLTGAAGTGKTRLALALAQAQCADQLETDCVFVDLSTVDDASRVELRMADALGVAETSTRPLDEAIGVALSRVRLLVLDNFEHVLPAAMDVARVLQAAPHVRVLVTSREPLHLAGEHEFNVTPLLVPGNPAAHTLAEVQRFPAVELFVTRARALDPSFELSDNNVEAVVKLVRRLDGLPLALELAAARTKLLSPEALLARLQERFDLLETSTRDAPARHRTLARAIGWSVDLLTDDEARLFRALAVFSGGWTIAAAQSVCWADSADVLGLLGSLLDKSLIYRETGAETQAEPRYGMLQTLRAHAHEQLQIHAELDGSRRRHAAYYLRMAEGLHTTLLNSPDSSLVRAVAREHANFQAAMLWSITSDEPALGVRLGAALWPYWFGRCLLAEGRQILEQVLDADRDGSSGAARAHALGGLAALLLRQEDVIAGQECALRALHAAEQTGDSSATALALFELGWIARVSGERQESRRFLGQARAAAQAGDDTFWNATSVEHLGILDLHEGHVQVGHRRLETSVSLHRAAQHTWGLAGGLLALARAEIVLAAPSSARRNLAEAVSIYRGLGDQLGIANCFDALAELCASERCASLAVRLFSAADALRETVGVDASWSLEPGRAAALETLRVELGPCEFENGCASGRALAIDDAMASGLAESSPLTDVDRPLSFTAAVAGRRARQTSGVATAVQPSSAPHNPLTPREREVAALIAEGHTNREIGERLVITSWTVESHVRHVLSKLGMRSRSQVAAWAVDRRQAARIMP
jgi:non-specific serine/threonine protein kinase